jgi:hypothetical protein
MAKIIIVLKIDFRSYVVTGVACFVQDFNRRGFFIQVDLGYTYFKKI